MRPGAIVTSFAVVRHGRCRQAMPRSELVDGDNSRLVPCRICAWMWRRTAGASEASRLGHEEKARYAACERRMPTWPLAPNEIGALLLAEPASPADELGPKNSRDARWNPQTRCSLVSETRAAVPTASPHGEEFSSGGDRIAQVPFVDWSRLNTDISRSSRQTELGCRAEYANHETKRQDL